MKKQIFALVPVKGASERIKNKNIRAFAGSSLYEIKLSQLQKVKGFAGVIVSSENEQILDTAKKYGFLIHRRDQKYSTSTVPMSSVYSFIASEIPGEHIAWVNVTNPLADSDIYEKAVQEYERMEPKFDCLLSVSEVQEYLFYKDRPLNFRSNPWPKSQDLKGVLAMSFVINILKRQDMVKLGSCVGNNPFFYCLDRVISTDVDFQENFDFCEMVYRQRHGIK